MKIGTISPLRLLVGLAALLGPALAFAQAARELGARRLHELELLALLLGQLDELQPEGKDRRRQLG